MGLYCGYNGRQISMVNLWGDIEEGQSKKYITKTWKIVCEPKSPQHAALIITRAISRLGEQQYKACSNNCEHYATWCYSGYSSSKQVKESVLNGFSSGCSALAGAALGAMSAPTVAVFGSADINEQGVALSVDSMAEIIWPYILFGIIIGAMIGYSIPKCMEVHKKRKQRKKLKEKIIKRYKNKQYDMLMMEEVQLCMMEIQEIVNDDEIDKNDLEEVSIALNDVFKILDRYYHRDEEILIDSQEKTETNGLLQEEIV